MNLAARWREEIATATMFLSRLPVGRLASGEAAVLSRATRWFPLVGLLLGTLMAFVLIASASLAPASVAIVVTLMVGVLLTGAFHEDGLADLADSAGAFGVDAKLAIMRDSRVGTYGALALMLLVLTKFVLLGEMLERFRFADTAFVLIGAHIASRWSSVWLMARVPYARPEAANRVVAAGVSGTRLLQASAVAGVCLLIVPVVLRLSVPAIVVALPLMAVTASTICALAAWRFRRSLGGITGDCLGAVNQLVEVAVLLVFVELHVAFADVA